MTTFLSLLQLALLLSIPGAAICILLNFKHLRLTDFLIAAIGLSICFDILAILGLLYAGTFRLRYVLLLVGVIGFVALLVRPEFLSPRTWKHRVTIDHRELLAGTLSVLVTALLLSNTPHFNFLMAYGMDAGNYEAISNYFWIHGSLFLDISRELREGFPLSVIAARNTWSLFPEQGIGVPMYFQAFPALLSLVKKVFAAPDTSWILNSILSCLCMFIFAVFVSRILRRAVGAVLLCLLLLCTPIYFYYSKQIMSEMLGLAGILLCLHAISRGTQNRSNTFILQAAGGLLLVLLTKLDLVYFALFLLIPVALFTLYSPGTLRRASRFFLPMGIASLLGTALDFALCSPGYLKHFSVALPIFPELAPQHSFIVFFGAGVLVCAVILSIALPAFRKGLAAHLPDNSLLRFTRLGYMTVAILWALFASWNLWIRPTQPADLIQTSYPHDIENLLRLFDAHSPILLSLTLIAIPFALVLHAGPYRPLLVMLLALFSMVVLSSHHSYAQIWWMRRYLPSLVPLSILSIALVFRHIFLMRRTVGWGSPFLHVALAGLLFVHIRTALPLFKNTGNSVDPSYFSIMAPMLSEDTLLLNVQGANFFIFGFTNTLSSVHRGPRLLDVPEDFLPEIATRTTQSHVVVLDTTKRNPAFFAPLKLEQERTLVVPFSTGGSLEDMMSGRVRASSLTVHAYRLAKAS